MYLDREQLVSFARKHLSTYNHSPDDSQQLMTCFDTLGLVTSVMIMSKILLQKTSDRDLEWDDDVGSTYSESNPTLDG